VQVVVNHVADASHTRGLPIAGIANDYQDAIASITS
jgi:hypothetical protein